ncbi:MAG: hypothetical protein M0D54_17120 [Hyphomonadaceae bacterium JAD_PAG50586_4]|nr:MAG: hypothetical protein M0D54_17120 [Hyphomonadaceae bacterium JAD_PAG50586_4]
MMRSPICDMLGIEFPLLAFSHCRDVVAAVSRAGGMGVFGAAGSSPERLREELDWIDAHCGGKPYGVDLIVPNEFEGKGQKFDVDQIVAAVPKTHTDFAASVLSKHGVDAGDLAEARRGATGFAQSLREEGLRTLWTWRFSIRSN